MLARKLDLPVISTGALLREEAERGTPLGRQALAYTRSGRFFPDEIAGAMLRQWMDAHGRHGWVLDGFPRTLPQALQLDAEFGGPEVVVALELGAEEIHRRLAERLSCPQCAASFGVTMDGLHAGSACPQCGASLRRREDDTPATVDERLCQHREHTLPVLAHYRARHLLLEVDAAAPREVVFASICRQLNLEVGA